MGRGAFLSNLTAKKYSQQAIADQASYDKKLELTRQYFTPETDVLEIGCGTGSTAIAHAPFVRSIEGIDYASKMIEIANEKVNSHGVSNASFSVEDVKDLAAKHKEYDAVLGMNILHLLGPEDQHSLLQNIYALLKPGAHFISSTVCTFELPWHLNLLITILDGLHITPPINVLSDEELKSKMEAAGFHIVQQWYHGDKFKVAFLVAQK